MTKDIDPNRDEETTSADDDLDQAQAGGPSAEGIPDGSGSNTGSDSIEDDSASGHGGS
jgi:hypothetical protein